MTVPLWVPLLVHRSVPLESSVVKKSLPELAASWLPPYNLSADRLITSVVPVAVPSVFHRPSCEEPLSARKYSVPFKLANESGSSARAQSYRWRSRQ